MPQAAEAAPRADTTANWSIITALLASGLCLRPPIVAAATLLPEIRSDFGFDYATGGLLTSIPVVCMGLFALAAPRLYGALGARAALTVALVLTVLGGALRAGVNSVTLLFGLTIVAGIGAGLAGALLPTIVRERLSHAPARATGTYSLGINSGAGLTAALAVPIAGVTSGWRGAFVVFGAIGLAAIAVWLLYSRGQFAAALPVARSVPAWRRPQAYRLGMIFALQAVCFYGLNAWLASAYVEWGWTAQHASWLVAVLNFITLIPALLLGFIGDRFSRPTALMLSSGLLLIGLLGTTLAPSAGWLWTIISGFACGALFPLILTMSVDAAGSPREVGAIAGVMLAIGYIVAGIAPVLLGAIRDATHDFTTAFAVLAGVSLVLLTVCVFLRRRPALV